jgi:hypothetical protein
MRRALLLLALLLALPAAARAATDSLPAAFAATAARELQSLRPDVTVSSWLAAHAGEQVERFTAETAADDGMGSSHWCARVRHRIVLPDGTVDRAAYFFVPDKPPSAALPSDDEAAGLLTTCQLGLVRVSATMTDATVARAAALASRDTLSALYDAPPVLGVAGLVGSGLLFRSSAFDTISHWRIAERHVLAASTRDDGAPKAIAVAALPISGMAAYPPNSGAGEDPAVTDDELVATAVPSTSLPAPSTDPVVAALRWTAHASAASRGEAPPDAPDVVTVLERWLAAVPRDQPRARAGALLVAHVILSRAADLDVYPGMKTGVGTDAARARLTACGARFDPSDYEPDGPPGYTGNWLREAWTLDDGGPAGDLALRLLLPNPCECPRDQECFLWTIREGERFLARPHDRRVRAAVHLAVAHAAGYPLTVEDGAPFLAPASLPAYRAKAVVHYRAAFALQPPQSTRDDDWVDAWRLLAGLPALTSFGCGC